MDLNTAIAHLRAAGFQIAPIDGGYWHVQYGRGPQALDEIVPSEALIAVATNFVQPELTTTATLDLAQTIALMRTAGMIVEPRGVGQWAIRRAPHESFERYTSEELVQLGKTIIGFAPGIVTGSIDPRQKGMSLPPPEPVKLLLMIARLGRITTNDLAGLVSVNPQELGSQLHILEQQGQIAIDPSLHWTLTPAGWQAMSPYMHTDDADPTDALLPHPVLAGLTNRLLQVCVAHSWGRIEIIHPSLAGIPDGQTARVTIVHEPRGFALTRNLAAQAALSGLVSVTMTLVLLHPEDASPSALQALFSALKQPLRGVQTDIPCLIASNTQTMSEIAAALRTFHWNTWMLTTIERAQQGDWGTHPANVSLQSFIQALQQTHN